jgi:hypothetical protein
LHFGNSWTIHFRNNRWDEVNLLVPLTENPFYFYLGGRYKFYRLWLRSRWRPELAATKYSTPVMNSYIWTFPASQAITVQMCNLGHFFFNFQEPINRKPCCRRQMLMHNFFLYCGVNYLLDVWPHIFHSPYMTSVIDNWMSKEHWWNDCDRGTEQY